jgi:hypothetical protein
MFIKINSYELPCPARGINFQYQQLVDSERNAMGVMVGQKINRRLIKLDGVKWPFLTDAEWSLILIEIEKFRGTLTYWDSRLQGFYEMEVYWGDATGVPEELDSEGRIIKWRDCQCNIVDTGNVRTAVSGIV